METENDNKLKFLDMIVHKIDDKFETEWTLKDTNTGVYTPNVSFAPSKYKTAAIRALIYRAKHLSSNESFFRQAYDKIVSMFLNNGFHIKVIEKIKNQIVNRTPQEKKDEAEVKQIFWRLPFIREKESQTIKTVRSINQILPANHKFRVVFDTYKSSRIFPNKDKVSTSLVSNLVYKYKCWQCDSCYIGETRRHFITRIQEHIEGRPRDSEITKHVHKCSINDFSVIFRTKHTAIAETLIIKQTSKSLLLNEHDSSVQLHVFNL